VPETKKLPETWRLSNGIGRVGILFKNNKQKLLIFESKDSNLNAPNILRRTVQTFVAYLLPNVQ